MNFMEMWRALCSSKYLWLFRAIGQFPYLYTYLFCVTNNRYMNEIVTLPSQKYLVLIPVIYSE